MIGGKLQAVLISTEYGYKKSFYTLKATEECGTSLIFASQWHKISGHIFVFWTKIITSFQFMQTNLWLSLEVSVAKKYALPYAPLSVCNNMHCS